MQDRTLKILIVDDDDILRPMARAYLEQRGYEVDECCSGEEALSFFAEMGQAHGVDLLLIDQVMPGLDGINTYQNLLEQNKDLANMPAIMASGYCTISLVVEFMRLGGIDFIEKGDDFLDGGTLEHAIERAVRYVMDRSHQASQRLPRMKSGDQPLTDLLASTSTRSQGDMELPTTDDSEPWKILVVDDDETVHQITSLILGDFLFMGRGIVFQTASSAAEAKKAVEEDANIALILLDVVMETRWAGLDVVDYVRQHLGRDCPQIILRTGQAGELPEAKAALDYNIDGYIAKENQTPQGLITVVTTALRAYRKLRKLAAKNDRLEAQIRDIETCP